MVKQQFLRFMGKINVIVHASDNLVNLKNTHCFSSINWNLSNKSILLDAVILEYDMETRLKFRVV